MKKETMAKNLVVSLSVGIILAFLTLISGSNGGNVFGAEGAPLAPVQYTIHFSQTDLSFGKLKGYDVVRLDNGSYLAQRGQPMLPTREIKIALPQGMAAQAVRIIASELEEITGEYYIFPAQPPIRVGSPDTDFVVPDDQTYSSNQPYPSKQVELVCQSDLAGQGIAHIMLYPLQYIPSERKLTLYTSFTVVIECSGGYKYGDRLSPNASEKSRREYEQMIKDMVANPEDVQLGPATRLRGSTSLPDDTLDHVIITSSSYVSYFQPLVDWHIQRGSKDTVITTESIYANYKGSSNQEKIRNFIIDAESTWGTTYFLLAGEHSTVPFEYRTYYGESTPSDQYYSDYDDDWVHEVYVGRVTVGSTTQINTFIDKVLKYEKDPPRTNYPLDMLLIGMDLEPSTPSELMKETIDSYIPPQFNVTKVYDSHSGNHRTAVINALNAGQNLVNHADHANYNYLGTGYYWHGWGINNSDVNALSNDNQMSVVVSLGCHPNHMDYNDCIAEYFVIYNPYQAGVAFTGNTRDGWGYVGYPEELSGKLDKEWWIGLFSRKKYNLGQILADSKHHFSTSGMDTDLKRHCEWTFNLLGEPEMPLWTDSIKTMVVTHPDNFPTTPSSFPVHVEDAGGNPVDAAYVCLWKGDEVYERGYTDHNGDLTLGVSPSTQGTMSITVTAQNFLPYQGSSECTGNLPPVAGFTFDPPDPTRHDTVQFSSTSYDNDGTIVSWQWDFGDDSTASGEQVTHLYENYASYAVTLIVEDDGGISDTAQTEVTVKPICGDVDDDGTGPNVADLTYFVAFIFDGGPPPPVMEAANVDGEGGINVADVIYLVDYIFFAGPALDCAPIE